jgi:hypothetical protein
MMQRETFKDADYWNRRVEQLAGSVARFEEALGRPALEPEHRSTLLDSANRSRLKLLIARYSRGDSVADVRAEFPGVASAFHRARRTVARSWNLRVLDNYVEGLWLLSLAVLFEAEQHTFHGLASDVNGAGHDALYDRLVASRQPGLVPTHALVHPKPYQPLFEAIAAPLEQQGARIATFLKQYYAGMKKTAWHDTHLAPDAGFFGYWCFELAALVKVHGIPDTELADNLYYPRDLVGGPAVFPLR